MCDAMSELKSAGSGFTSFVGAMKWRFDGQGNYELLQ